MIDKDLRRRDAKRNIGDELFCAVQEMKAGKAARVHRIPRSAITKARTRSGLSQARFE
jgi:putative transcriptional regulator